GQLRGERDLALRGPGERQAALRGLAHGFDDRFGRVPEDQARVVAVEVDPLVAIGVPHVSALAALYIEGIRIEEGRGAAVATRHDADRFFVQRARAPGLADVLALFLLNAHAAFLSCPASLAQAMLLLRAGVDALPRRRWPGSSPVAPVSPGPVARCRKNIPSPPSYSRPWTGD